jgi:hypothetical protein
VHDSLVWLVHVSWQGVSTNLAGLRYQESAALVVLTKPLMARLDDQLICSMAK